ncbi:hypothetical protein EP01_13605 [Bdellovibrio bacteriovorus]|nr:hypothetical protein EP01_13605 [Bdellovibrio bacteriovorus]
MRPILESLEIKDEAKIKAIINWINELNPDVFIYPSWFAKENKLEVRKANKALLLLSAHKYLQVLTVPYYDSHYFETDATPGVGLNLTPSLEEHAKEDGISLSDLKAATAYKKCHF